MLTQITDAGGVCQESKSFLFELRFANALFEHGIEPEYEVAGEGGSTIDFGFVCDGQEWAIELLRLEETGAARKATKETTGGSGWKWVSRILSSTAKDKKQSEEGETLKAIERICQKCEKGGSPYKFPEPGERLHVILVDFRTFVGNGGDKADRIHVGLGGKYLRRPFFHRFWNGRLITGVFDGDTKLRGAREAQERVHLIGFVKEERFESGAFGAAIEFIANPRLFKSVEEVERAIARWPLKPATVLNS